MTQSITDLQKRLKDLRFTAGMNQIYHQQQRTKYDRREKAIKILLAVITLLGVVYAFLSYHQVLPDPTVSIWFRYDFWGIIFALASLTAAIVLNIYPLDEIVSEHLEAFNKWSELSERASILSSKLDTESLTTIDPHKLDFIKHELIYLAAKEEQPHQFEKASPNEKYLELAHVIHKRQLYGDELLDENERKIWKSWNDRLLPLF